MCNRLITLGQNLCVADREWAYDRTSSIGRLEKALDAAKARGWTVVDMKNDWRIIYPFEKK